MLKIWGPTRAFRALAIVLLFCGSLFGGVQSTYAASNTVVISQVYGGGGNSMAPLNQDYIELFNNGTTPVALNGWSLQYRSSAGATAISAGEIAPLPNVTLQPGQFFLVAASAVGATGSGITADAQGTTTSSSSYLNLSGTAGQVYLVNSVAGVAAGCSLPDPSVVDAVGYGTAAVCSEGGAPTTTLSNTTSASRKVVCVDTDNNAADFTAGAPAPRNLSTAPQPCSGGGTQNLGVSATANPTAVSAGGLTLLTARVTAASNPASTGVAVAVDLSAIGGSSTQPLYDDGTHGDTTAGDNVFNYQATVGPNASGSVALKFTATDAQAHSATATATLNVMQASAVTRIHTIQAAPANYTGKAITVSGIVTATRNSGFYLQERDVNADTDATTSEALYVVTSPAAQIVIGNELQVTGTVQLSSSTAARPATEIGGTVTYTLVSSANALPTPIILKTSDDSPSGGFGQLQKYQSMRFTIPSFTVTAPTGGSLQEASETVSSNGEFYGVVTGIARPFAEPGISVLETSLPAGPTYCTSTVTTNCVPRFDANPENLLTESATLGGTPLDVTANQIITNLAGIVDFTFNQQELLLDPKTPGTLGTAMTYIPVSVAAANEFTIGSMNIERFYSNVPATGAVTLTTEAYTRRLAKVSLLLRNVQRMPDIIGLQEVGTLQTLNDLSAKISTDAAAAGQPDPKYATCLVTGNDSSGINTAFLIKTTRVTVNDCTQFGKATTFTNSTGAQATLNDRPPLVLHATVNIPGYAAFPVTVISNHLRSLNGIDDTSATGATVRLKKEAQDEYLAALIQGYQANGEKVVALGDLNSFAFSDGYVDNLGVIKGTPTPASQVVVGPSASYVPPSPVLVDLESTVADPAQRYDYSFGGNAQTLDHIVVTQSILAGAHIAYSHEDADFPLIQYNDATTPQSSSDHDGLVAFFPLLSAGQTSSATLTPATQDFGNVNVASSSAAKTFTFMNTGNTVINVNSITVSGDFSRTTTCGATVAAGASCTISVTFTPTVSGSRSGSLIVASSAITGTNLTSTLSGSGVSATASVALTPTTAAFGTVTVGATSAAQAFTLTNSGTAAATISTIALTGDYARTTTCGASLAAQSSCTISVTFSPAALGARAGTLTVSTSGSTSALSASLSGTGGAQATLTPANATFAATITGASTAAQTFTLTNTAGSALTLSGSGITISGDFSQTNTCGTALPAGASCSIAVVFTPTAVGTRPGTLTVTTSLGAVPASLAATLSGTGSAPPVANDFTLTPLTQTGKQTAGTAASTTLTLTANTGSTYTGKLTLTCTGSAPGSTCSINPTAVTLTTANPVSVQLNITTTTRSAGFSGTSPMAITLALLGSAGALLLLLARRKPLLQGAGLLVALLTLALFGSGCGSSSPTAATPTPAGTYTYTVTATDGTLSHSSTFVLTVQ